MQEGGQKVFRAREKEPSHVCFQDYEKVFKLFVSPAMVAAAKEGKAIFNVPGADVRARVESHAELLDKLTDVTFYPKKMALINALLAFNVFHENKLKINARTEAYALKEMFLCVLETSKSTISGNRLQTGMKQLVAKLSKKDGNFLMQVRQSPTFLRASKKRSGSVPRKSGPPAKKAKRDADEGLSLSALANEFLSPDLAPDADKTLLNIDVEKMRLAIPGSWSASSSHSWSTPGSAEKPMPPLADAPRMSDAWRVDAEMQKQTAPAKIVPLQLTSDAGSDTASLNAGTSAKATVVDSFDHFTGKGKRLHPDGSVEYADAVAGDDSFLQCVFENGDVFHTGIPALVVELAAASIVEGVEDKANKRKAKAKAKASAKAEAKAKAKAKAKASAKAKAKAKSKAAAKSEAAGKAKAKSNAQAMAAAGPAVAPAPAPAALEDGDRVNAFYGKLTITKAKAQSYIQFSCKQADGKSKKKLVVAVSQTQSAQHNTVILDLAAWINQHDRELTPDELKEKRIQLIANLDLS